VLLARLSNVMAFGLRRIGTGSTEEDEEYDDEDSGNEEEEERAEDELDLALELLGKGPPIIKK